MSKIRNRPVDFIYRNLYLKIQSDSWYAVFNTAENYKFDKIRTLTLCDHVFDVLASINKEIKSKNE